MLQRGMSWRSLSTATYPAYTLGSALLHARTAASALCGRLRGGWV